MKLSVLIPVYNEQTSVETIVRRVTAMVLASVATPVELELIAVDDCSTDGTPAILDRLHGAPAEAPGAGPQSGRTGGPDTVGSLRVIRHPVNRGKGAAIQTALAAATGDFVIIQDADFEYDPADIPRLLAPVVSGKTAVVYGARPLDGSGGRWLLDFGNRALTWVTNVIYGTRLHDMETCYKLLPTALLRSFRLECRRFDMEPEITAKVVRSGYRIIEVPIDYRPRTGGKKLSARKDGLPALQALVRYRTWRPTETVATIPTTDHATARG